MGNVVSILKAIDCSHICESCSKYVCNSMQFRSSCCDLITIDCQTNEIEVSDNDSEISIEISDCCLYHKK